MKKKILSWVILIILLGIISLFVSNSENVPIFQKRGEESSNTNNSNPDFKLKTVEGQEITLSNQESDFILLNFWAIRCPYCLMQMEELRKLDKNYSNSKLKIIGICVDNEPQRIKELIKKYKVNYPTVISKGETHRKFGGIRGVPVTFLLDSERNILEKYIGYVDKENIDTDIK